MNGFKSNGFKSKIVTLENKLLLDHNKRNTSQRTSQNFRLPMTVPRPAAFPIPVSEGVSPTTAILSGGQLNNFPRYLHKHQFYFYDQLLVKDFRKLYLLVSKKISKSKLNIYQLPLRYPKFQ